MATTTFPANGDSITEARMLALVRALNGVDAAVLGTAYGRRMYGLEVTSSGADITVGAGAFCTDEGTIVTLTSSETFSTTTDGSGRKLYLEVDADTLTWGDDSISGLDTSKVFTVCEYDRSTTVTALYTYAGSWAGDDMRFGRTVAQDRGTDLTSDLTSWLDCRLDCRGVTLFEVLVKSQPTGAADRCEVDIAYDFISGADQDGWNYSQAWRRDSNGTNESVEGTLVTDSHDPGNLGVAVAGTNGVDTICLLDGIWWIPPGNQASPVIDVDLLVSTAGTFYAGVFAGFQVFNGGNAAG